METPSTVRIRGRRRLPAAFFALVLVGFAACQQRPADARHGAGDASTAESPMPEGSRDMDRSPDPGSPRAGLGPAELAFDRYGLVTEEAFDEVLRAVVQAERAYAADAEREGMKAASLRWMRADATVFDPQPGAAATVFGEWDEQQQPRFAWAPQRVEASAGGDLAVSTGPYRMTTADGAQTRHGHFFSVWQRQPDGAWLVIADLGTAVPEPPVWPTTTWGHRVQLKEPRASVVPDALPLVQGLEAALAQSVAEFGSEAALARHAADDIHLLRTGVPARMGREFLSAEAALGLEEAASMGVVLAGAAAAASNDLAAGWGVSTNAVGHRDAFVRVWRREQTKWLVAFDVRVPMVDGD